MATRKKRASRESQLKSLNKKLTSATKRHIAARKKYGADSAQAKKWGAEADRLVEAAFKKSKKSKPLGNSGVPKISGTAKPTAKKGRKGKSPAQIAAAKKNLEKARAARRRGSKKR